LVLHGRQWSWHFLLYGGKKSGAVIQQSAGLTLVGKYISHHHRVQLYCCVEAERSRTRTN
jgi:hypothetical protein